MLCFEPDRLSRQALKEALGTGETHFRVTMRADPTAFKQSLDQHTFDAVVLGFPMDEEVLLAFISAITTPQSSSPLLVAIGANNITSALTFPVFPKSMKGYQELAQQLQALIRVHHLRKIHTKIPTFDKSDLESNLRTQLAEQAIESLAQLGFAGMYISIDPLRGRSREGLAPRRLGGDDQPPARDGDGRLHPRRREERARR